ncbi:MAG: 50S ribosomal protein L17 [Erysipelotrichaceae bacterium]|jgi:large subunit ribosomal protein L17|nr:50S ribosomal protein L17 [Erysipelotrichaceae bacterium]
MPAQGRKNVHGKTGVRFKAAYTKSKRENMLRNVVSELIIHEHVTVTSGVAKELEKLADSLITIAKKEDKVTAKRLAARTVRRIFVDEEKKVSALDKLFNEIAPRYATRNGGYTVNFKVENRKGDNAAKVLIAWAE